jgi:hypothetical protein
MRKASVGFLWLFIFSGLLLDLDVFLRVSSLNKIVMGFLSLIALKQYLSVLCRSAARAEVLHFLRKLLQVYFFAVQTVDDGHGSAEFACFSTYKNFLLLFTNLATNTDVFRKPAYGTNFNHYVDLCSLSGLQLL